MSLNQSRFALPVVALFRSRRFCIVALLLAAAAVLAPQAALAASQTWNGGSLTDGNWSDTANWVGTLAPGSTASTTNTDTATFNTAAVNWGNAVGNPVVIDQATQNIGSITFDTNAGSYFIGGTLGGSGPGGNSLLLSSGGQIQITSALSIANYNTAETINAPLAIQGAGGSYTFTNNSLSSVVTGGAASGTLVIAGSISGGAAGNTTLNLTGANLNANTVSGNISNGAATTLAITENSTGTWVLSGNNSYTGNTTLTSGILDINSTTALGGGTVAINGGTIDNTSGGPITLANNQPVTIGNSFSYNGSGNLNLGSGIVTIANGKTITLNATGTSALTLGALTNTAAATAITLFVNGATNTLNLGSLVLENAGSTVETDIIKGSANITIAGAVSPGSAGAGSGLTYTSNTAAGTGLNVGTLTFQGANTYTGATTISGASIINYQNGTAFGANSPISVVNLGTAQVQGGIAGGNLPLTLNGLGVTFVGGQLEGALENMSGNNSYSGPIVLGAASAIASDSGTLTLSGSAITGNTYTLTLTGAGSGSITGNIQTTSGGLTKNGAGAWTLGATNSYSGVTTLAAGTLVSTASGTSITPFGTGTLTLQSGTLGLAPAGSGTVVTETGGAITYQYGSVTVALNKGNQTSVQFTVPSIARPNPGTMIIAPANGTGGSFNGIVGGGGSGDLGTGENFVSTANNNGNSPLPLTNGIVSATIIAQNNDVNLSGDFVTTSAAPYSLMLATYNSSTNINTAGATAVYNANSSGNGSNTNTLTGSPTVYALNTNGQTITASGTQTLTVNNTGSPAGVILNGGGMSGGFLAFGGSEGEIYTSLSGGTISSGITGGNGMETFGPGTLTLSGPNRYTGNTNVLGGTLTLFATGAVNNFYNNGNALSVYPGATLNMSANNAYYNGNSNYGTAGLYIDGGTVNVSGAQSYFGATQIYNGTMNVNSGGALGYTAVAINTNNGTIKDGVNSVLNLNTAGAISQNAVTITSGILNESAPNGLTGTAALVVSGANGMALLSQANNFVGDTVQSAGVLQLSAPTVISFVQSSNANAIPFLQSSYVNAIQNSTLIATGGVLQLRADSNTNFASAANYISVGYNVDVGQSSNSSGKTLTLSGPTYLIANGTVLTATSVNLDTLGISSLTLTNPVNYTPVGYNSIGNVSAQLTPSTANITIGAVNTNGYVLQLNGGAGGSSYLPSTASNITGSGAVNVSNGPWVIGGTNTYNGTTLISAATTITGSVTSPFVQIGSATTVTGSLSPAAGSSSTGVNYAMNTIGTGTVLVAGAPFANPNGTIYANSTLILDSANSITSGKLWAGFGNNTFTENTANAVSGSAALTIQENGNPFTLSQPNNYIGATTINAGGTTNGNALTLNFAGAGAPLSNIINNGYTHAQIVGTSPINGDNSGGSSLVLVGGGLTISGAANVANSQEFNGLTLQTGVATGLNVNPGSGGTATLVLNGITRNIGSAVDFVTSGTLGTTGIFTTTTANTAGTILGGWATSGGTTWAVSAGNGVTAGNITALASGGYTTTTTNGTTAGNYASTQNIDVTTGGTNLVLSGAISANSLRFNEAHADTLTLTGANVISSGGILNGSTVAGNASTITGGSLTSGNGQDLIVTNYATGTGANALTINSAITNNGGNAVGLTIAGPGTAATTTNLGGNNTFTGGVYLAGASTVILNSATALGQTAAPNAVFIGSNTQAQSILELNNQSATIASLGSSVSTLNYNAATVENGSSTAGTATLTIGTVGSSANTTYYGNFKDGSTGLLALNLVGGTLNLASNTANNYSGGTTLSGGVLVLSTADGVNAIGTGTLGTSALVFNGGTLQASVPAPFGNNLTVAATINNSTTAGVISGPYGMSFPSGASFTAVHGGNATLTSSITGVGPDAGLNYILTQLGTGVYLNPQLLTIASPVYLSDVSGTGGSLTINGSGLTSITGIISNYNGTGQPGNLTYSGSGILAISGANTFTGVMNVSPTGNGKVYLTSTSTLQNETVSINAANGLAFNGNNTYTLGALSGAANETLLDIWNGTTVNLALGTGNANPNATYSGVLAGPALVTKNGAVGTGGTETFSGANLFSGGFTINGGSVQLGSSSGLNSTISAAGTALAGNYSTISAAPANTPTAATNIAGGLGNITATLVMANAVTLDLHGSNLAVGAITASTLTPGMQIINNGSSPSTLTIGYANSIGVITNSNDQDLLTDGTSTLAPVNWGAGTTTLGYTSNQAYTGGTTVTGNWNGGTLKSTLAATTGTPMPFGPGNITINGGVLALAPATSQVGNIATLAGGNASNQFTYAGGAILSLTKGATAGASLTVTIGNAGSSGALNRSGNGTLFIQTSAADLNSGENVVVAGAAPTVSNGMVNASIVGLGTTATNTLDFLTYTSGFAVATYGDTNFAAPSSTTIENVTSTPGSNLSNTSVFALRSSANITIANGQTLTIGNYGATDATHSPQAGVILNGNATISGGSVAFGAAEGVVYTFNTNGYATSGITSVITGSGGVTFAGNSAAVNGTNVLGLGNANTFTGGVTFNNVAVAPSDGGLGAGSNVVTFNGAELGGTIVGVYRSAVLGPAGLFVNDGYNAETSLAFNISGPGAIYQQGAGYNGSFLYLSGNNSYTGGTFTNGTGFLMVESDANLGGPTAPIGFAGGQLTIMGNGMTNLDTHPLMFQIGQAAGFDIQSPTNTFTVDQVMNQQGGGVNMFGAGTLVLTAPEQFTGGLNMYGGTLKVDYSQGASLVNGVGAAFYGGTLDLKANSTGTTTQTLGTVTLGGYGYGTFHYSMAGGKLVVESNGGAGMTVNLGQFNSGGTGISNFATTAYTPYQGTTLNITETNLGGSNLDTVTTQTAPDSAGIYTGRTTLTVTTSSGTTTDWATTNNLIATPYTLVPYAGYTTVTAPAAYGNAVDFNNSLITSGATLGSNNSNVGNWTTNSLKINNTSGGTLSIGSGNTLALASGGLLFTGSANYTISGGNLAGLSVANGNNGAGTQVFPTLSELIVHQYGTGTLTINSSIPNYPTANGGTNYTEPSDLVKTGPGAVVLSGVNTYLGPTFIQAGVLSISADDQLGGGNGAVTGVTSLSSNTLVTSSMTSLPAGFGPTSAFLGSTVSNITGGPGAWVITLGGNANTTLSGGSASFATAGSPNTGAYVLLNGGTLQVTASMVLQESNSTGSAGTSTQNRQIGLGPAGGTIDITNNSTLTLNTSIQSTGGENQGPGPFTLTSSDNGNGVLYVANNSNLNIEDGVTINGGTLRLSRANAIGGTTNGLDTVTFNPPAGQTNASLQLNGNSQIIAGLSSTGPNAAYAVVENGNGSNTNATLTVNNGGNNTFAGILEDTSSTGTGTLGLTKEGGAILSLTNTGNAYSGVTTLYNGILNVASVAVEGSAGGTPSGLGSAGNAASKLLIAGGILQYTGATAQSTDRLFTIGESSANGTNTATIDASGAGSGTLSFTNTGSIAFSGTTTATIGHTLVLTGSNSGANIFAPAITDAAASPNLTSLHKTGPGKWELSGSNTYSGASTVNGGTLAAVAAGALSPYSAFTVNSGALDVTAASQTVSGLTIGAAGALNLYDLYPLSVSGSATFALGSTLNITMSNTVTANTPDLLMTYGVGQQSGSFSTVYVNGTPGLPPSDTLYYSSGSLEIITTGPSFWISPVSGNWTPGPWTAGVPNAVGAAAGFSGTANTALTCTLEAPQTVGTLLFGNTGSTSTNYTLTSSTLTLNNSGTASVTVLSGSQTIASTVQIAGGNLAIALSGSGILNFAGNISDDGSQRSLSLGGNGSGQLVLSGSNSYGGPTNVNAGTLYITNTNALPPESNLSVGPGGTFIFDPNGPAPTVATSSASHAASAVEAVPEPGTLALLIAGLAVGFGVWSRRRS